LLHRNIQRSKQALDPINIELIDLIEDWISEEPTLLEKDDFEKDWESLDFPLQQFVNLRIEGDVEVSFDEEDDVELPVNEGVWQQLQNLSDDENAWTCVWCSRLLCRFIFVTFYYSMPL